MIGADPGDVWTWTNDAGATPPSARVTGARTAVVHRRVRHRMIAFFLMLWGL